ncbi:MAG: DsbE family thiol:disulfide interchange protein, partial [Wenzhouxiangella sp.]
DDALTWLDRYGDAWSFHMVDFEGRAAIDLGVYGAPETFLIDHEGIIRHKHIGPIDANSFEDLMRRIMVLRSEADA